MQFSMAGTLSLGQCTIPCSSRTTGSERSTIRAKAAADKRAQRQENVKGDFYVDHTCIDKSVLAAAETSQRGRLISTVVCAQTEAAFPLPCRLRHVQMDGS